MFICRDIFTALLHLLFSFGLLALMLSAFVGVHVFHLSSSYRLSLSLTAPEICEPLHSPPESQWNIHDGVESSQRNKGDTQKDLERLLLPLQWMHDDKERIVSVQTHSAPYVIWCSVALSQLRECCHMNSHNKHIIYTALWSLLPGVKTFILNAYCLPFLEAPSVNKARSFFKPINCEHAGVHTAGESNCTNSQWESHVKIISPPQNI